LSRARRYGRAVMTRFSHLLARLLVLPLCAWLAFGALPPDLAQAQQPAGLVQFKTDKLVIRTAGGKTHAFKIELAATPAERAQGLMFRRALAPDAGMLFDFGRSEPVAMWMENTLIPLDMLFIAADGRVVNIAQRTVPMDRTPIPSKGPVKGVLELPGGTAARLGLKPGDVVQHAMFAPAR
jgi:uncharacterized membrane protein (UPF0127 family)